MPAIRYGLIETKPDELYLISGRTCGAVWTFERYIDYELEGFVRDVQTEISKTECEDLCLSESRCGSFFLD